MRNIATWLNDQLVHRAWTPAELTRRSGLSDEKVRQLLDPARPTPNVTIGTLRKLGHALHLPADTILVQFTENPGYSPQVSEIAALSDRLPAEAQDMVLRMVRRLVADLLADPDEV